MICILLATDPVAWLNAITAVISVGVAVLTLIVAIVIGISVYSYFRLFRQSQLAVEQMRGQVQKVIEDYKLSQMKPPNQIIEEVKAIHAPQIEDLRADFDKVLKIVQRQLDETRQAMQSGSRDSILREVEAKFRSPRDLEETVLRKVLDGFLRVQALSQSEREAISQVLVADRDATPPTATGQPAG